MGTDNKGSNHETSASARFSENLERLHCVNFQSLKNWQIKKYRSAVDEHRKHLSRSLGSFCIDWAKAERDFNANGLVGLANEWRHQYCGSICPFRNSCLLAYQFKWVTAESDFAEAG